MTGTIIFLSIFLVIIAGLIGIAIYGSKKDKRGKQKELNKLHSIEAVASKGHAKSYLILDSLLDYIDNGLEQHKDDPTSISISTINNKANEILTFLLNSKEVARIYEQEDRKNEFKPVLDELKKSKPSLWNKNAIFATNLIRAKAKFYKSNNDFEEEINLVKNYKWN